MLVEGPLAQRTITMASNQISHDEYDDDSQMPVTTRWTSRLELGPYERIIPDSEELQHRILKLADYEGNYELWQHPIPKDASVETLLEQHRILHEYWRLSPESHSFKELFVNVILKQEKLKVSSGMCLGLGSLTADWEGKSHGKGMENRSLCQLVAFEACIELLREYLTVESSKRTLIIAETKHAISDIYFQDPAFNALDRAFLLSRGYMILHTPESETHVTESTFVFTPGTEWDVCLSPINTPSPPVLYITRDMTRQTSFECQSKKPNGDM